MNEEIIQDILSSPYGIEVSEVSSHFFDETLFTFIASLVGKRILLEKDIFDFEQSEDGFTGCGDTIGKYYEIFLNDNRKVIITHLYKNRSIVGLK